MRRPSAQLANVGVDFRMVPERKGEPRQLSPLAVCRLLLQVPGQIPQIQPCLVTQVDQPVRGHVFARVRQALRFHLRNLIARHRGLGKP